MPHFSRSIPLVALLVLAGLPSPLRAAASIPATSALIRIEGRTEVDAAGVVWMGFPAVTLHVAFSGDRLEMQAIGTAADASFDVGVDGAPPSRVRVPEGASRTVLWQGAPGAHQAEVVRRTEAWMGLVGVVSLASSGGFGTAPALPERRLLFIGDSFTCGASSEARDGVPMEAKTLRQNARLSYGWMLSRLMGAQCHIVGCGGRGLLRDWQGMRSARFAGEYYQSALPDDAASHWDPRRYVPDGIGVCIGTNDFDEGIPDQTEFVRAYVALVNQLRHDAPLAQIFLIDSPILRDPPGGVPKHTVLHAYLEQVVLRVSDPRVRLAPIQTYPIIPGDGHPNGASHRSVVAELEPQFRAALGWR